MSLVLNVEPRFISPYVFACFVTLREKGLAFATRVLDADAGATRTPEYLAKTVTGRVPTLLHGDLGLGESQAIIEYLDDAFPEKPVLPKGPEARARCRQLMSWIRSDDTEALRAERPTTTMFYEPARASLSENATRAAKKLVEVAGRVLRPGAPNIFDAWTIIDAELAFILHRLIKSGDPVPSDVKSWAEAQWKRETVQAFVHRPRPPL
jgi:glutathione S-transferase